MYEMMSKSEKREFKCQDAEMPWLRAQPCPRGPPTRGPGLAHMAHPTVHHTWRTWPIPPVAPAWLRSGCW